MVGGPVARGDFAPLLDVLETDLPEALPRRTPKPRVPRGISRFDRRIAQFVQDFGDQHLHGWLISDDQYRFVVKSSCESVRFERRIAP